MRPPATKLVLCTTLLLGQPGLAQESAAAYQADYWGFSLGAFFADQDMVTDFDVDSGEAGTDVDFEDDLGLRGSQSVFRLTAFRNFNARHQIDFDVFDLSQTSSAVLEREIKWRDTVFPIAAAVDTDLDFSIYKVAYTYFFWRESAFRVGVTGGLYIADIGLRMGWAENDLDEVGAVTAPLPVFGLRAEYHFAEHWRLSGSAEWFGLEFDGYDGTLDDSILGLDYQFSDRTALGLGYNRVHINVDATEKNLRADLDWRYSGYFAYLRLTF
jgi:hypothetical protein